jgi:biotin carboxylase
MLGGSHFQVPSIQTAVRMGLYTITCDYLPDNPGHKYGHEYHNVSTTDHAAVLKLAKDLKVDGVVAYASDPAAPTAAYVAEQLGLPTSPYESVEILANKDLYRAFLAGHGFNTPRAGGYSSLAEAEAGSGQFKLPVLVKPVDSSGSKGVSLLEDPSGLAKVVESALSYSRAQRFIVEEYVRMSGYQVAGDGFSVNGDLVFRCFANDHFDERNPNPFVPVAASWPYSRPKAIHDKIHSEIQRLISLLGMKTNAYNFDIRIDPADNVYLMEIGPRNGGNMIPQVIQHATGVDMAEYTIKAALGLDCSDLHMVEPSGFWAYYAVHSKRAGRLKALQIDPDFERANVVQSDILSKAGDEVNVFTGSGDTLGTMILRFGSEDEMLSKISNMDAYVRVLVD